MPQMSPLLWVVLFFFFFFFYVSLFIFLFYDFCFNSQSRDQGPKSLKYLFWL